MIEFTFGGAWFRWSALGDKARRFVAASFLFAAMAGVSGGIVARPTNYWFGYDLTRYLVPIAVYCLFTSLASAWFWYRFSVAQDEMFNRIQNWSLGMAGAWTCCISAALLLAAKAGVIAQISAVDVATMFAIGVCIFWFIAVRKWA